MVDPVVIGRGSNKWLFDSNTKYISLFNNSDFGTKTLHTTGNVDYLVPAGRKFIMLEYSYLAQETTFYYDTSADTAGTQVWYADGNGNVIVPCWIEFPAGNYVTVSVTGGSTAQGAYAGIETTT